MALTHPHRKLFIMEESPLVTKILGEYPLLKKASYGRILCLCVILSCVQVRDEFNQLMTGHCSFEEVVGEWKEKWASAVATYLDKYLGKPTTEYHRLRRW